MKALKPFSFFLLLIYLTSCSNHMKTETLPDVKPPVAAKKPHEIVAKHGKKRIDDYYWMKEREDTAVINYLTAENKYCDTMMAHTKALQEKLFNEMKSRIKEDDSSVPYKLDDYYYYTRVVQGGEYPVYCRKKNSLESPEEIIVDGNELGKGQSFLNYFIEPSHDHKLACVVMDTVGRNFYTIRVKNLETGAWLDDMILASGGGVDWTSDSKSFFYTVPDKETLRQYKVIEHKLHQPAAGDALVYEEKDSTIECEVYESKSRQYIFIRSGRTDANLVLWMSAANPGKPVLIAPLEKDVKYSPDHAAGDVFLITTNRNAKNYRLVQTPISKPTPDNWKDIIPERKDILLENVDLFRDYFVAEETSEGLTRLRVIKWKDMSEHTSVFDEPAYDAGLRYMPDINSPVVRYTYTSFTTPNTTYDFNFETHDRKLMKQQEVAGGYDKNLYSVERVMVTAHDGKKVPMSIAYRKDKFNKNGNNPGWIYGYGSYGYSIAPGFSSNRISILDRGFVFASAHIRGGKDMGGAWYEDGKMVHKKNTFTDFIDCSDWLVKNKYTSTDRPFASGGSAGGLLIGAITNMRSDLYRGVIAQVPFVDVVTTMMDESIPLTTFEWLEWGNPSIPDQYDYMLSYSPYDNVEKKNYPNLLVMTGLHDSQVQYWEPAKWVAKLREMKTDNNLLFLHTNMDAGHGGVSGRYRALKDIALQYAFAMDILGIKE